MDDAFGQTTRPSTTSWTTPQRRARGRRRSSFHNRNRPFALASAASPLKLDNPGELNLHQHQHFLKS
jgi:hypothetical protein